MRIRLACAAGLLLSLPATVMALWLGPLQTNSSLNEPFEGKIFLVDAKVEELDLLEFPLVLSDFRFELVQPKTGGDYVRIWSKQPVREPVLDFLLEINWWNGRPIREFTVLMDPPRYEATRAPSPPRAISNRSTGSRAPTASKATAREERVPNVYGPTRAGDTLWRLALDTRPPIANVQQMMIALLKTNPGAFVDDNINRLKQGQILRIPDAAAISSVTPSEGLAAVRRQNALWEEYRQRLAEERKVAEEDESVHLRGRLKVAEDLIEFCNGRCS
ncbi:MAG: type IV pilus assembly protein FimV [Gammaproteobacteria bacterium]